MSAEAWVDVIYRKRAEAFSVLRPVGEEARNDFILLPKDCEGCPVEWQKARTKQDEKYDSVKTNNKQNTKTKREEISTIRTQ